MRKATVYRYLVLDTNNVEPRVARRWGTREAIHRLRHAEVIENSMKQVDEEVLNVGGFTPVDFEP